MTTVLLTFTSGVAVSQASTGETVSVEHVDKAKEVKVLKVSDDDKVFLGVCGGIGEYLGIDSDLVRIGFVVLSLAFGVGLITYLIAFVVMVN